MATFIDPNIAPEFRLPSFLSQPDPELFSALFQRINDGPELGHAERPLLTAVLLHLRDPNSAATLLAMSGQHLRITSHLLREGLLEARGCSRPIARHPLRSQVLQQLGLREDSPKDSQRPRSRGNIAKSCAERDSTCRISHINTNLEATHIIPFSVTRLVSRSGSSFWTMIWIVFGQATYDAIWGTVGSSKGTSRNGILLSKWWHGAFDAGAFDLIPAPLGEPAQHQDFMDVRIRFRDRDVNWHAAGTVANANPALQHLGNDLTLCKVQDGDTFRLAKPLQHEHPLPSPSLLMTRVAIYQILSAAECLHSIKQNKRKWAEDDHDNLAPGSRDAFGAAGGGGRRMIAGGGSGESSRTRDLAIGGAASGAVGGCGDAEVWEQEWSRDYDCGFGWEIMFEEDSEEVQHVDQREEIDVFG